MKTSPNPRQELDVEALQAELDRVREMHAKFRALYNKNVGALVDQLDTATEQDDRLKAENQLLGEALDEAISENAVLALGVRTYRETAAITAELGEVCLRYGIDPDSDPELDPEADRAHAAADAAIAADEEIRAAYDLIEARMLGHIRAVYDAKIGVGDGGTH